MLGFPIFFFLLPYAVFVMAFVIFSIFNTYHLLRYGIYNFNLYLLSAFYLAGTIFILGASLIILKKFDWSEFLSLLLIFGENDFWKQYLPPM